MLFQIPITNYTVIGGVNYIRANVPCPFNGRYRVSLVNFTYYYTGVTTPLPIQLLSKSIINPVGNSPIVLSTNPNYTAQYVLNKYSMDCILNGIIDIDIRTFTLSNGAGAVPPNGEYTVPANFGFCVLTFDIEKIN